MVHNKITFANKIRREKGRKKNNKNETEKECESERWRMKERHAWVEKLKEKYLETVLKPHNLVHIFCRYFI